jgi:hypothetical protein
MTARQDKEADMSTRSAERENSFAGEVALFRDPVSSEAGSSEGRANEQGDRRMRSLVGQFAGAARPT